MPAPTAFISYSHDSEPHKDWVLRFASDLRERGVDVTLDRWDLSPGQDVAAFMERGVSESDRVLMICTPNYVERAERGSGGVGFERLIVTGELVSRIDTKKFIPVIRQQEPPARIPAFLGPRLYVDFNNDDEYRTRLEELAKEILGVPVHPKPPLGVNPYTSVAPPPEEPPRVAGPSGLTTEGRDVLNDGWFVRNASTALEGLQKIPRKGAMELRFALHAPIRKSQLDLLNAMRKSEIPTFGWPIGATLENKEEYRPRPTPDGIRAEIAIPAGSLSGRESYDYWALRNNGDFYLLQSLFEDDRRELALFFNTRIVRVAESILFASNLYTNLGVAPEALLSLAFAHRGLAGRTLASSNPNRHVFPRRTVSDESQVQIVDSLGSLRTRIVDHVMQVAEPLFMLFDFAEFKRTVYEDIVGQFVNGHVT